MEQQMQQQQPAPVQRPTPQQQDLLNKRAAKAAPRRFTGEPQTGFGSFA